MNSNEIKLGVVSKSEIQELQDILHWRNAIVEVSPLLKENEVELRNKAIQQLQETYNLQFAWWDKVSSKYGWQYSKEDTWHANTADGIVYLTRSANCESEQS